MMKPKMKRQPSQALISYMRHLKLSNENAVPRLLHKEKDEEERYRIPRCYRVTVSVDFSVPEGTRSLSYEALEIFTDYFSKKNLLCKTKSTRSRVYRGRAFIIDTVSSGLRDVIVERWNNTPMNCRFWRAQIKVLMDPEIGNHPNVAKLYGYCDDDEDYLALVYDCQAVNTLHDLILDDNFTWAMRIKVALQVSNALNFLHSQEQQIVIRNLEPYSILLDKDFNPILFGFGMACGGILGDRVDELYRCKILVRPLGYADYYAGHVAGFYPYFDVYSFGALLVTMITKSHETIEGKLPFLYPTKAYSSFGQEIEPVVHERFSEAEHYDQKDAADLLELAMKCVEPNGDARPRTSEVVECIKQLIVAQDGLI